MGFEVAFLRDLLVQSLRQPRSAALRVIGLRLPLPTVLQLAAAVASASAVLSWLASAMFPVPVETPWAALTASPVLLAVAQLAGMLLVAGMMTGLGRMFGGHGRFGGAFALAVWIEVVLLCVQVLQVALMLLFPLFASALGMVAFVFFLVMLTQFTAALHGFDNATLVFVGLVAMLLLVALVVAVLLGMFGLVPGAGV